MTGQYLCLQATKRKYIEYKRMLYNPTDTLPYNNCYIMLDKDSLFYYREGKLEEVRTMVREEYSNHSFTFKEDADDHIYNDSLPVFTIGHDNKIYGLIGNYNASNYPTYLKIKMTTHDSLRQNLLNGTTSLYRVIQNLPPIKK